MKRRKAIQQIGVGLSAGLFVPSWLASCQKADPGPEVPFDGTIAIIGAGAAGLYAADILRSKGLNIKIFEASNQLGGRIRSLRNQKEIAIQSIADFPAELGAEIVFGSESSWHKIIKNFNLPTIELTEANDTYVLDNIVKGAAGWQGDADFAAAQNFVKSIASYTGSAVSIKQAAASLSARAQGLVNAQLGNDYGTIAERLGAKPIAESIKLLTHDRKRFTIATNPMQDILLSRFSAVATNATLNTPIVSVNYGGEKVVLTSKTGEQFEVEKVLVTVPLSIMKSGSMSFAPVLSASKTSAMSRLGMDACIRVIIDFKKNFWGEATNMIWGSAGAPQMFNTGYGRSSFYRTLSVTINGSRAEQLTGLSDQKITEAILADLDALYEGQGTGFVRRDLNTNAIISFVKDWTKDEFIKGGYSYPLAAATNEDRKNLALPVGGKLFFAGEATDTVGDGGTVNGALNSAERAVEDIVKSIVG